MGEAAFSTVEVPRRFAIKHKIILFLLRVVAVDMRGYGDSDKPRSSETYQLNILIEDVRQLILKLGGLKIKSLL